MVLVEGAGQECSVPIVVAPRVEHRGTAAAAVAGKVADQSMGASGVHALAVVGIAVVEAAVGLLPRIVPVSVQKGAVPERNTEVDEGPEVAVHVGAAPDLRRVGDVDVAGGLQRRRVVPLDAADGLARFAELGAQVEESVVRERQSGVDCDVGLFAVAHRGQSVPGFGVIPVAVVLQNEVHDAGDRVGAVLGRGPVPQDLDPLQRDRGNHRQVRPLCTFGSLRYQPGDDRAAVAALAVHEHQRVVCCQIADAGRAHDGRAVGDRLRVDAEGRDDRAQQVQQIGPSLCPYAGPADDVDRRIGLDSGPATPPGADNDDLGQLHHLGHRIGVGERVGGLLRPQPRGRGRKSRSEPEDGGVTGPTRAAGQNETVTVMDTVRGAPSQAAFSVIADRYGLSKTLFATIENSVDRNRSLIASPLKLT